MRIWMRMLLFCADPVPAQVVNLTNIYFWTRNGFCGSGSAFPFDADPDPYFYLMRIRIHNTEKCPGRIRIWSVIQVYGSAVTEILFSDLRNTAPMSLDWSELKKTSTKMSKSHPHLIRIQIYGSAVFGSGHTAPMSPHWKEHLIDEDELAEGEEGAGPHPQLLDSPLSRTVEL